MDTKIAITLKMLTTFSWQNLESLTPKGWKFWKYCQKYSDEHLEILQSITVLGRVQINSEILKTFLAS